ncbi:polymorphic toxin-type HINT domain-containing protein [Streptomyces sp. NPDC089799]|uniref:polymorphic toxin-type HINT domain-containing protein n=1 Tax=Streptomyces sp. NPDC089799 TaxID=3155066 RepID=UPI00344A2430
MTMALGVVLLEDVGNLLHVAVDNQPVMLPVPKPRLRKVNLTPTWTLSARNPEAASGPACKLNSFPTGTSVQMADGTTKEIQDVRVGDTVMATDPQTGKTRPKKVLATITTPDDKEFTDLALSDDAAPRGPPSKLTSTRRHPHRNETRKQWVDAGDFSPGGQLIQPDGRTPTVQSVLNYPAAVTTHNLTVDDFHTYYVLAAAPLLVHNCSLSDATDLDLSATALAPMPIKGNKAFNPKCNATEAGRATQKRTDPIKRSADHVAK